MQHTANFRSSAAQDSFEFIAKCSVPFAHTHRNAERKGQARRVKFRAQEVQLQRIPEFLGKVSGQGSPYYGSVDSAIGDRTDDGITFLAGPIEADDLVLKAATGECSPWWRVVFLKNFHPNLQMTQRRIIQRSDLE